MLVNMKEILQKAQEGKYAVIAASCDNEVCMEYAITAAENMNSPIILNLVHQNYPNMRVRDFYVHVAKYLAEHSKVPVAVNQDHGSSFEAACECINCGFDSIMVDRSRLSFEENIAQVSEIVRFAHGCNVSVEAELGHVGIGNIENANQMFGKSVMTDPDKAAEYVQKTDCDFLAVSIGNAHGVYANGTPHIDFERLEKIHDAVDIPLVLHGGSGTGDENLSKACKMGICKVNVGTELRIGAIGSIKGATYDELRFPFNVAFEAWQKKVEHHIKIFGSENKA